MTLQPEAPPAPPRPLSPEAAAQLRAENAALEAQIANRTLREMAGAPPAGQPGAPPGNVSVIKNDDGRVVVTGADGRTVTIDPKAGLEEDAVQEIVQTALAPPPVPQPPRGGPPESVMIVAIVFSSLVLMTLLIAMARAFGRRRPAAGAQAVPPEVLARLTRIEQAVEAVAIEVERISESERYSARLLTERLPERAPGAPNGQGQPQALAAPTRDASR